MDTPSNVIDINGCRYGRLTVVRFDHSMNRKPRWLCRCDCGAEFVARGDMLKSGNTRSCGCLKMDGMFRHGHSNAKKPPSPTYVTWQAMITRTTKRKAHNYKDYGAAGVKVCDRWRDFRNFLEDMGERPEGTTLDRWPVSNGDYEPGNCRWATPKEQANNRRNTLFLTVDGETRRLFEWAEIRGIPVSVIKDRLRLGWNHTHAVNTPYVKRS